MHEIHCDVAIIGTDVSGVLAGLALRKLGLNVQFVDVSDDSTQWLADWTQLHQRRNRLDWRALLPSGKANHVFAPLQLATPNIRIAARKDDQEYLPDWLERLMPNLNRPDIIKFLRLKSPRPPSPQTPTLALPSGNHFARIFKSQRGRGLNWPLIETTKLQMSPDDQPSQLLLRLLGVAQGSPIPTFSEDDLGTFFWGHDQQADVVRLLEHVASSMKEAQIKCAASDINLKFGFQKIRHIRIRDERKLSAETYLLNTSPDTLQRMFKNIGPIVRSVESSSTLSWWRVQLIPSAPPPESSGRLFFTDSERDIAKYCAWRTSANALHVDLITEATETSAEALEWLRTLFPDARVNEMQEAHIQLADATQANQCHISTPYRNALHSGRLISPFHTLQAHADVAEELLKAVSLYREQPLNLSTLPHASSS